MTSCRAACDGHASRRGLAVSLDDVIEDLLAVERVIVQLVHTLGDVARRSEDLGEPEIRAAPLVGRLACSPMFSSSSDRLQGVNRERLADPVSHRPSRSHFQQPD
jgi:hypothetical protein